MPTTHRIILSYNYGRNDKSFLEEFELETETDFGIKYDKELKQYFLIQPLLESSLISATIT